MAAEKQVEQRDAGSAAGLAAPTPSPLDQSTHNEMLMLYRECADSIRFAKLRQWKTLAGTLGLFAILGLAGRSASFESPTPRVAVAVGIAVAICSIYVLFIYHFWQATERSKIALISNHMSSLMREVRALTSQRESNVHRYILLFFMIGAILAGIALLVLFLAARLQPQY